MSYGATYLPEVIPENNWTKLEAIKSCLNKAGYHKEVTEDVLDAIKLTRYQTAVKQMTYDEYITYKGLILVDSFLYSTLVIEKMDEEEVDGDDDL